MPRGILALRRGVPARFGPSPARAVSLPGRRILLMRCNEVADVRVDGLSPAATGKNAIVAGALGVVVELPLPGSAGAQLVRGARLAGTGNVVQLAFDRQ